MNTLEVFENNGWSCSPYTKETVKGVQQWEAIHAESKEKIRFWEIEIDPTTHDRVSRFILFWGYAKKTITEIEDKKCTEWKLLIDYADTAEELDSLLYGTLKRIYPDREKGLEEARLMPGFDMLGGED
jgi:hypothetical protein